jgi:hypothetical protein
LSELSDGAIARRVVAGDDDAYVNSELGVEGQRG